jgi:hypothetical protein
VSHVVPRFHTSNSTFLDMQSVLSEVYAADKMTSDGEKIADGAIVGLMRKGIQKRVSLLDPLPTRTSS